MILRSIHIANFDNDRLSELQDQHNGYGTTKCHLKVTKLMGKTLHGNDEGIRRYLRHLNLGLEGTQLDESKR